jgi:GTPase
MNYRLTEGHGECLYQIGFEDKGTAKGIEDVELESSIRTICRMAAELHCEVFVSYIKKGRSGKVAQLLVRRKVAEGEVLDVRV